MRFRFAVLPMVAAVSAVFQSRPAAADLNTGFEAPAYTTGSIVGQNGWTDNSASVNGLFNVSTSNPSSGTQALAVTDGSATGGYQAQLFSPGTATGSSSTLTSFKIDFTGVNPPTTEGAVHTVYLVSSASTDVDQYGVEDYVGGFNFQPDGDILVEEYSPDYGGYMSATDTGVSWTPNSYHTCTISVDAATGEMIYTYDGQTLADTTAFYEQTVGNVVLTEDSESAPGEVASLDDLSVTATPEPASLGLLGFGACGLMLNRRRSARA